MLLLQFTAYVYRISQKEEFIIVTAERASNLAVLSFQGNKGKVIEAA
jgi:hypothetical protein